MPRTATINGSMPSPFTIARSWERIYLQGKIRLAERLKEHGVKVEPYMPMADNVLVLRLPPPPTKVKTEGGLFIPETAQEEPEPLSEGILVQAGMLARDVLRAHGIVLGDHVQIGRFAGWEKEFAADKTGKSAKRILQMKERDILGSFDLFERLFGEHRSMQIIFDPETEEHRIVPITDQE
jgi:co-chaperonin GroES (HSP10)